MAAQNVGGLNPNISIGSSGGPGGWAGGDGGSIPTAGQGPGGGPSGFHVASYGAYATIYGNQFILPLLGGSGGGGTDLSGGNAFGGGGGGGAILIAASGQIQLNGGVSAIGGGSVDNSMSAGGSGSGGAVRLVASKITGAGVINATGGNGFSVGGAGRVRIDTYENDFHTHPIT